MEWARVGNSSKVKLEHGNKFESGRFTHGGRWWWQLSVSDSGCKVAELEDKLVVDVTHRG